MNSTTSTLCGAAMLVLLTACSSILPTQSTASSPLPPPGSDGEYQVIFPQAGPYGDRFLHMAVGADTFVDCRFESHSAFNKVEPRAQDRLGLNEVAECLNRPHVRQYNIVLIGRADARGSSAYNASLGQKRAGSVRDVLVKEGVDPQRIRVESHGEVDAVGAQPLYSHGYDRRVDVVLENPVHAPARVSELSR